MKTLRTILLLAGYLLVCARSVAGPVVDINTADAARLAEAIDGVGQQKAVAIIEHREANGPFTSVDELASVKGIGMKTVDRNRGKLTVVKPAR